MPRIPRVGALILTTIRRLLQLQRQKLRSSNPVERFAAALLIPAELRLRLGMLRDFEIAQLLEDEVGAGLNVLAPESTICDVATARLCRHSMFSPERKRFGMRLRTMRLRTGMRNEGEHVMHAESALYRAGIPFLLLPFQQNRFASDTFMVRNIAAARLCLHRAGFRVNRSNPTVLIDWQTRKPIRLYEDTIVL